MRIQLKKIKIKSLLLKNKDSKRKKPPGHQKLHCKNKTSILRLHASIPLRPCL